MLDFNYLRSTSLQSWRNEWDFNSTYPQNVLKTINRFILYPSHDVQSRIVACFLCLHSCALNDAFILYLTGRSRSGKSTTGKLAAKLTGAAIHGSNSTAGIRNYLEDNKYSVIDEDTEIENNQLLILEDVNSVILSQPALYQLLKTSCNRDTAQATIANLDKAGENKSFDTFCLKIISSVFDPRNDSRFEELVNRCLFIHCERIDKDLPQIDDYDWTAIEFQHQNFWEYSGKDYFDIFNSLRKPSSIALNLWQVFRPIIAIGLVGKLFNSIDEAITLVNDFLELSKKESTNPFYQLLLNVCDEHAQEFPQLKGAIPSQLLEQETRKAIKSGSLPFDRYSNSRLWEAMTNLGYFTYQVRNVRYWIPKKEAKPN